MSPPPLQSTLPSLPPLGTQLTLPSLSAITSSISPWQSSVNSIRPFLWCFCNLWIQDNFILSKGTVTESRSELVHHQHKGMSSYGKFQAPRDGFPGIIGVELGESAESRFWLKWTENHWFWQLWNVVFLRKLLKKDKKCVFFSKKWFFWKKTWK